MSLSVGASKVNGKGLSGPRLDSLSPWETDGRGPRLRRADAEVAHAVTHSPQRKLTVSAHAQKNDIQAAHAFSQTPGANYGQSGPHYGWCYILLYTSVSRRETHTSNSQHCIGCPCTIRRCARMSLSVGAFLGALFGVLVRRLGFRGLVS